jgi:hypothetical protein
MSALPYSSARYAIVRGKVRPATYYSSREKLYGIVEGLGVGEVNVPLALRGVVAGEARHNEVEPRDRTPFDATVAFGRRLEPWIISAAKK